ncbi:chromophore lyase CRL, chloroplastic-like [Alnus glutinosa]|uniref:chromophore lyase CRL, chloroplastic-like n=1 Tax=Alnus glutinosa TaxID=3517 RepID=UPI002D77DE4D|nr:chromophore lyase CRL, chloroplastic-like [Alnus glutinosa]
MLTCPAAEIVDGSKVLYFEQAFWRTPQKPFRQGFYMVKPCPKELKCDVEVSSYAIRDVEEYKNFCDRPKDQRPLPEEVLGNGATYCTSELAILKNNEIHSWDRGYDIDGNQVWGAKEGPYEFKPVPASKG